MLMVVTALYCEAKPFIQHYHLKKNNEINIFQVFRNEEVLLIITNTGSIAAAVGTAFLCNLHSPGPEDFLVNIGVCGCWDKRVPEGSLYIGNKITEQSTGRSFYLDMLFKHPFDESGILTYSNIVQDLKHQVRNEHKGYMFDMEAAGICQAGAYYFQPNQMIFLKVVSDYCDKKVVSPEDVTKRIEMNIPAISAWLDHIRQVEFQDKNHFTEAEETYIERLAQNLKCSVTMEYQVRQLLIYYKLVYGNSLECLSEFTKDFKLPCKTKMEGKRYLDQLKAKLI